MIRYQQLKEDNDMHGDPILRTKHYTDNGTRYRITVTGGLHYMRGNNLPYFSLTSSIDRDARNGRWVDDSGGANHDEILRHFPELADLAALHLSDIDGVPSSAEANGWYWLAGSCGGLGERYHGGNREYGDTSEGECLRIFAEYVRIPLSVARAVRQMVLSALTARLAQGTDDDRQGFYAARESWREWCEEQKPRWKVEAQECIARHGLVVYGDAWEGVRA